MSRHNEAVSGVRAVNALLGGFRGDEDSGDDSRDNSRSDRFVEDRSQFQTIRSSYDTSQSFVGEPVRYGNEFQSTGFSSTGGVVGVLHGGAIGSSSSSTYVSGGLGGNSHGGAIGSSSSSTNYVSGGDMLDGGLSRVATAVLNAQTPISVNETAMLTVRINGQDITGVWVNRDECLNWRGPIPIERYAINTDSATIIRKKATHTYEATQNVSVKYLKPPPLQNAGDLIIRHEADVQLPAAPPIIIRQAAAAVKVSPALIYREKPPRQPQPVAAQTISIPGRTIDPPPRQVIVERMAAAAALPQDIIIERWLGYNKQKRNIVHQRAASQHTAAAATKNVLIDWETQGNAEVRQKYHFLGVETADPYDYERRHGHELVETNRLPHYVNDLMRETKLPSGEQLAANVSHVEYILTGDIDALKLVDNKKNLQDYLLHRF